jgi:hypothetical protein
LFSSYKTASLLSSIAFYSRNPEKKKKHMCVAEYKLQLREGKRKEIFYLAAS